jgi:structure-specific recognition protein 1
MEQGSPGLRGENPAAEFRRHPAGWLPTRGTDYPSAWDRTTADFGQDYERLSKIFKSWYSTNLENKEHSLRGWNWGKAEFGKAELTFNVQNRPAFEVPYSEISNTNLAGRNEIAVEFSLGDGGKANGQNGATAGKGRKAAAGRDQLTEIRFYIPGTTTRKEAEGGEAGSDADEEEKNAVTLFYDTLIEKAEIGETAGDTIATFLDVLHLTPRFVPYP